MARRGENPYRSLMELNGLTKQQWGNVFGGGICAWIAFSFAGALPLSGIGFVAAVVGGVQLLRIRAEGGTPR